MKEKLFGYPSCNRISHDNTNATSPIPIAVIAYWMAMIFGVLAPDVLSHPGFRVVELYLFDFGGRGESRFIMRDVRHWSFLLTTLLDSRFA